MRAKNITARQFAEEIGIQPSGMSHILGGRNKPSLDFVTKVIRRYPEIDANWLLLGRGEMYVTPTLPGEAAAVPPSAPGEPEPEAEQEAEPNLFSASVAEPSHYAPSYMAVPPPPIDYPDEPDELDEYDDEPAAPATPPTDGSSKRVLQRMLFIYSDKTFEEYTKR